METSCFALKGHYQTGGVDRLNRQRSPVLSQRLLMDGTTLYPWSSKSSSSHTEYHTDLEDLEPSNENKPQEV